MKATRPRVVANNHNSSDATGCVAIMMATTAEHGVPGQLPSRARTLGRAVSRRRVPAKEVPHLVVVEEDAADHHDATSAATSAEEGVVDPRDVLAARMARWETQIDDVTLQLLSSDCIPEIQRAERRMSQLRIDAFLIVYSFFQTSLLRLYLMRTVHSSYLYILIINKASNPHWLFESAQSLFFFLFFLFLSRPTFCKLP